LCPLANEEIAAGLKGGPDPTSSLDAHHVIRANRVGSCYFKEDPRPPQYSTIIIMAYVVLQDLRVLWVRLVRRFGGRAGSLVLGIEFEVVSPCVSLSDLVSDVGQKPCWAHSASGASLMRVVDLSPVSLPLYPRSSSTALLPSEWFLREGRLVSSLPESISDVKTWTEAKDVTESL
jgi:hypothetical protein